MFVLCDLMVVLSCCSRITSKESPVLWIISKGFFQRSSLWILTHFTYHQPMEHRLLLQKRFSWVLIDCLKGVRINCELYVSRLKLQSCRIEYACSFPMRTCLIVWRMLSPLGKLARDGLMRIYGLSRARIYHLKLNWTISLSHTHTYTHTHINKL